MKEGSKDNRIDQGTAYLTLIRKLISKGQLLAPEKGGSPPSNDRLKLLDPANDNTFGSLSLRDRHTIYANATNSNYTWQPQISNPTINSPTLPISFYSTYRAAPPLGDFEIDLSLQDNQNKTYKY